MGTIEKLIRFFVGEWCCWVGGGSMLWVHLLVHLWVRCNKRFSLLALESCKISFLVLIPCS